MSTNNLPAAIEAARRGLTQLALETLGVADTVAVAYGLPLPDHTPGQADGLIPSAVAYLGSALEVVAATCRAASDLVRPMVTRWQTADRPAATVWGEVQADPPFVPDPPRDLSGLADVMAGREPEPHVEDEAANQTERDQALPTPEAIAEEARCPSCGAADAETVPGGDDPPFFRCRNCLVCFDPYTGGVTPDGFRVVEAIPATSPPAILDDAGYEPMRPEPEPSGRKPRPRSRKGKPKKPKPKKPGK